MKKLLCILLTLLLGFSTLRLSAQETLTVADGTTTNSYVPFYGLWMDDYTHSQAIYPADMLVDMTGATITAMTFHLSTSPSSVWGCPFNISLGESASDSYSTAAYITSNLSIVYTGQVTIANNELTITFDNPFTYTGSNLVLDVQNTTTGTYSSGYFYGISTTNYQGAYAYNASSTPTTPSSRVSFIPKTTFTYLPSGTNCFPPNSPVISDITAYQATLSWTPRENQTAWEVYCASGTVDLDQVSWTPVTSDSSYTFTNLTPATNYTAYVRTVCGTEVSNPRQVSFTTIATCANVPSGVNVSNITATSVDVTWTANENDNAWEVVVVPANMNPEDGTPEQASSQPFPVNNLLDNTQYKVYVRTDCGGGDHSYWSSPKSFTTLPFCSAPLNVTVSQITANSALVSWEPAVYGATSYTVEYSLTSEDNWTDELVDGTQFMLSGLEPDSTYRVMVYSNCPIGNGDTVNKTFTTKHCLVGGDLQIGEGTSTTTYYPTYSCYNYSYTQQIFLASEMSGPTNIHSIAFDVNTIQSSSRHISIYLMHTNAATSDWLTPTTAQLVYNGTVNLVLGWNTFTFNTPFQYNGNDNLALIIIDSTGTYSCSNSYRCHTASATLSHCQYQDGSPYSISSIPSGGSSTTSSTRCNVIFGGDCDNDATCIRPNIFVTETSETSITLDWAPGSTETAWDVEYSTDDSTWTIAGTANTHPYEVSGLSANTRYYFHVRSNCGSEQSDWSATTARTECGVLTQIPYSENFEDASILYSTPSQGNYILCWDRYASDPAHYVYIPSNSYAHSGTHFLDFHHTNNCFNIATMPQLASTIDLSDLMVSFYACRSGNSGSLEVGVMTDKDDPTTFVSVETIDLSAFETYAYAEQHVSLEDYTGNGTYIAFRVSNAENCGFYVDDVTLEERPTCMYPSALAVTNVGNDNVTITWTENGTATSWNIAYGTPGFDPEEGEGTVTNVTDNPYTLTNLIPATTYDIYVQSGCGSEWAGPISATPGQYIFGTTGSDTLTTCGVLLYDNGGPAGSYSNSSDFTLYLYPENPNARMALSGISSTESCCDYLRVYDSIGTNGQQLAEYKGEDLNVNILSQSGPLTLVFHSDGSVVKSGFAITATCVTCFPPTNVTASDPTMDGATITWSGNADSYVLFLNGDMTTGYDATGTTYTFNNLSSSTLYSVQVASICDGDTSMLSGATTFATACGTITVTADEPWTENFESYGSGGAKPLVCWETPATTTFDNGTFPAAYCGHAPACHSGTNSAEFKGNNGEVNIAVLPEFTNNIHDLRLSFWATATSTSNGVMEVGVLTDLTDLTTFEVVDVCGTPGSRGSNSATVGSFGNYMGAFDFNNTTATTGRIALRFTSTSSALSWNLDDFTVELIPDCPSPVKTSVTASNLGGHVATISWVDNNPSHTAWTVHYKPTADSVWVTEPATDTFKVLTGLDPLTSYDVYVTTDCGTVVADPDATFTIHFTTTVACPAPTGLTLASVSTDEATITWNGTASAYNVEYGETGFTPGTGTPAEVATESITLTNLDPSTSYTIYVNSDCTDNNDSLSTTVSFTFTTTQIPAPLPYTADFTQTNEWILNNGTCANYWTTGTVNSTPSLFVTNNGTTPGYSVSNASIVSAEKLLTVGDIAVVNISFDAYVGGESTWDYLKVFFAPAETAYPAATSVPDYAAYSYSINALDLSSFGSASYPYKLNLTNDTLHVTVEMPNPNENATSTSTAKLVFVWRNDGSGGTQPGAIISNVNVAANTCPMPSSLVATNFTSNSVTLSWTPGDNETSWEIAYGSIGFDPDDDNATIVAANTNPFDIQNLDAATSYEFYVRAVCSATDQSAWAPSISVITPCSGSLAVPYTENFDSYVGSTYSDNNGIAPACWTTYSTNTTYGAPHITSSGSYHYVHSGTNCMVFTCGSAGADAYAALPTFTDALNTLHLNFWRAMESTSSGTLTVGYVTDLSDMANTFVTVATIPSVYQQSSGDTISVDFTGADIPANGNICFHWNYSTSFYSCCIDDITVTLSGDTTGPGPVITNPTVATNAASAIAQTTATLNATITNPDNVTITAKGFEWKTTTGGSFTQVAGTGTGNTYTANLTNLSPSTGYTFKAFITYNGTTVYGDEMTFTTLDQGVDPCNVPTGLHTTNIENHAISIAWDNNNSVESWNIQYRVGTGTWSSATSTTNSYTITNLAGLTTYEIQVQANCGNNNLSDWSSSITAQTTNVGIENFTENNVTLFPNPAKEYVDIRIDGDVNVTNMEVFDVYGKLINTVNVIDNPTRINVNGLADGMYFVRVTTDKGAVTKTFVKK